MYETVPFCNNNIFVSSGMCLGICPDDITSPEAEKETLCTGVCVCMSVCFITIGCGQPSAQGHRPAACLNAIPYFQEPVVAFGKHRANMFLENIVNTQLSSNDLL